MRRRAVWLLSLGLLVTLSAVARAVIWGPLTIQQIQDPGTPPDPTPPDTVGPVYGIVTGFDTFGSGKSFYIQNSDGAPWKGLDVFTAAVDPVASMGLALGDSVLVEGRVEEFQGLTEIVAKDGSFGTNLIVTKISSGNPLPPFRVTNTAELNELPVNPNAEQWEGSLVRVNGPLRIVRTNCPSGCSGGLITFTSSLVVDDVVCPSGSLGPCDSMFIDVSTLCNPAVQPGTVGQILDFVQGIYGQATRGYRIQCRDANDYGIPAPPNLANAYSIGTDTVRVQMDRGITPATATDPSNFSVPFPATVASAAQVASNVIDVRVSGGPAQGDPFQITVSGLVSQASGLAMASGQTDLYRYGIVTPAMIQAPDPDTLAASPCRDEGQYENETVTFRGICTARFGSLYYLQGTSGGLRNGVTLFGAPFTLVPGRQYVIAGTMTEFFRETEMTPTYYGRDEGFVGIPTPITLPVATLADTTCDGGQSIVSGEDYEGMLVKVVGVKVLDDAPTGGFFDVVQAAPSWSDTINIDDEPTDLDPYTYNSEPDDFLDVAGILRFSFNAFRIFPRDDGDITLRGIVDVGTTRPGRLDLRAWPNPGSSFNVSFSLPQAGRVKLGVFDLMGRQVVQLADRDYPAGVHDLPWDGRRTDGSQARSGVYFYKLEFAGKELARKAVRLE
jgi:hypothetical protein